MPNFLTALVLLGACAPARAQEMMPAAYQAVLLSEMEVLKQGVAQRKPGESDSTFLRRLFSASFDEGKLIEYA